MAGDFVPEEEFKGTGIQRYFNTYTLRGRLNWVIATYTGVFAMFAYYKYRKNRKNREASPSNKAKKFKKKCQKTEYY